MGAGRPGRVPEGAQGAADGQGRFGEQGDSGTFHADRFRWHTTAGHHLILDLHEELFLDLHEEPSGTWDLAGRTTRHHAGSQTPSGRQLVLAYQVTAGQDSLKRPATLLKLDQPINVGTIGDRSAFHPEPTQDEQGPATRNPKNRQAPPEGKTSTISWT